MARGQLRIVSWNCRGGFHNKYAALCALAPDIAIVQECRTLNTWLNNPSDVTALWHGSEGKRGLGVIGFGPWKVDLGAALTDEVQIFLPVSVQGPAAFNVLGVWTKPSPVGQRPRLSYIGQLHRALQIYETFVQQKPTVIVGDLNANAIWDHGKPWQYRAVINALNQRGSVSIYHALTKEPYGQERQDTYQHHTGTGFHIDHCFVPDAWITPASRVWIGDDVWLSRSDHRPFIVDLELNAVA